MKEFDEYAVVVGLANEIGRLVKKYLGISIPRVTLAILMIIFGIIVIIIPALLVWIVAIYLIVSGILTLVEEYSKKS